MKKTLIAAVAALSISVGNAQEARKGDVLRLDPALDAIVSPDAKIESLVSGDLFLANEGPVWMKEGAGGFLLFSDQASNKVWKITPDGKYSAYLENSGFSNFNQFTNIHPWNGTTGALLNSGGRIV